MAMNGNTLGTEIKAQLIADGNAINDAGLEAIWQSIGTAIVAHIVANGVISTTGLATLPVQVVPATGTGATTAPDTVVNGTIA